MTAEDRAKLRVLCDEAAPTWELDEVGVYLRTTLRENGYLSRAHAYYLAALSPRVVRALLDAADERDALKREVEAARLAVSAQDEDNDAARFSDSTQKLWGEYRSLREENEAREKGTP